MNRVDCTSPGCGNSEPFDDAHPDGWMYVKATHPPLKYVGACRFFVGTCPACVRKSREQPVKVRGGVRFNEDEIEAGTYKDRQKSLFGEE